MVVYTSEISCLAGAIGNCGKNGLLNLVGVYIEIHVTEHHYGRKKQCSGIGFILSSNIRSSSMNRSVIRK